MNFIATQRVKNLLCHSRSSLADTFLRVDRSDLHNEIHCVGRDAEQGGARQKRTTNNYSKGKGFNAD